MNPVKQGVSIDPGWVFRVIRRAGGEVPAENVREHVLRELSQICEEGGFVQDRVEWNRLLDQRGIPRGDGPSEIRDLLESRNSALAPAPVKPAAVPEVVPAAKPVKATPRWFSTLMSMPWWGWLIILVLSVPVARLALRILSLLLTRLFI